MGDGEQTVGLYHEIPVFYDAVSNRVFGGVAAGVHGSVANVKVCTAIMALLPG